MTAFLDWQSPAPSVQTDAMLLVFAALRGDTAEMNAVLRRAPRSADGPLVNAALDLSRALVTRVLTPDAMPYADAGLAEIAAEDPDPDRQLAARLLFAHGQLAPTEPEDNGEIMLHNGGVEAFNDAVEAAGHTGRFTQVFIRALSLWGDLLNGKGGTEVPFVVSELWYSGKDSDGDK